MLSEKQKSIIEFIQEFWSKRGYPPTIRDIMQGCQISSTSVVTYNLNILAREGYIRRHPDISRGIELVQKGSPLEQEVALLGTIAAGKPIPVPDSDTWNVPASQTISVPADFIRGKEKVYALRVKGNSMMDALINDGDIVLMQYLSTVENGEMAAVWLKAEKEVTLKKFYIESKNRVRLQPANSQMKPIYTTPDNVEIQGKVIAVVRRFA